MNGNQIIREHPKTFCRALLCLVTDSYSILFSFLPNWQNLFATIQCFFPAFEFTSHHFNVEIEQLYMRGWRLSLLQMEELLQIFIRNKPKRLMTVVEGFFSWETKLFDLSPPWKV